MTIKKLQSKNLSGFRLVIASASTANLGQFVADLVVNTLQLEKFALVSHAAIPPLIGPSAYEYSSKDVTTASEMFIYEKEKLVLLLIRTPITAFFFEDLISEILQFVQDEKMTSVIQLSSAFSSEQHFIGRSPYEYLSNDLFKIDSSLEAKFSKSSIEKVHGSGIALKLHERATSSQIPSLVLYKFTSEGENTLESIDFSKKVSACLFGNSLADVKIPVSWKNLFGFNVNAEIY